eukprot:4114892-Prymnesium_polylepis.1
MQKNQDFKVTATGDMHQYKRATSRHLDSCVRHFIPLPPCNPQVHFIPWTKAEMSQPSHPQE